MILKLGINGMQESAELRIHSSLSEQSLEGHVIVDKSLKHRYIEVVRFNSEFMDIAVTLKLLMVSNQDQVLK